MVGKLMKHELRALFRILMYFAIAVVVLGALARLGGGILLKDDLMNETATGIIGTTFAGLIIGFYIYAIFAFMYSAAFSIYMMMSSLISLIVTLLSNLFLGRVFSKKEETRIQERYGRTLPWMKKDGEDKKNDKKRRK